MDAILPNEIINLIDNKASCLYEAKKLDALVLVVTHLFLRRMDAGEMGDCAVTELGNLRVKDTQDGGWYALTFTLVSLKRLCKRLNVEVAYGDREDRRGFDPRFYFNLA